MKNFMKRILGVLAISIALIANINAAEPTKKVEEEQKHKLQKSTADLDRKTQGLQKAEKVASKKPTAGNKKKVKDMQQKVDQSAANAVGFLDAMTKRWTGDEIGAAEEELVALYKQEKELITELNKVTAKGYIWNSPEKGREEEHKDITSELKQVRAEIKNQEAIAGTTRSRAIKRAVWAISAAALLGAAVAADWYFETGIANRGYESMRGGFNRAYEMMPDVRGRLNRTYEAMPSLPAWVPGTQAARERDINKGLSGIAAAAEEQERLNNFKIFAERQNRLGHPILKYSIDQERAQQQVAKRVAEEQRMLSHAYAEHDIATAAAREKALNEGLSGIAKAAEVQMIYGNPAYLGEEGY